MDDMVGEEVLGPVLLHMRRVLADNERAQMDRHLRSGRVNARVLGRRAPFHDPRLFQKKRVPGKKSYAVLLGIDISGSTVGLNIALAKQAAFAQAELCNRLGIDFGVYAHSATLGRHIGGYILEQYTVKDFDDPWNKRAKESLLKIGSWQENLDGHSLEYYRKKIERHSATDKIILYYTDGKMPAANSVEELEILQREIAVCRRKNITLLGVGIRTDSPEKHGLNTVQIDGPAEVGKVVHHLESALLHNR
jgi:cobalamin biosynthesis protein CobT